MTKLGRWLVDRLGLGRLLRTEVVQKIFPDHWSFLFGEIALYCFVILVLTGIFLIPLYRPSGEIVHYSGSYAPLVGVPMSQAYRSLLDISFDVRAGLLVRQIHHWAANLFAAAILLHLTRLFLTGAYRRPRELNWVVGVGLLAMAMANGYTGYSIGDDLLSGTGLRIGYAVTLSVPLLGPYLAFLVFGGPVPSMATVPRLYGLHIFIVPALIAVLLVAHLGILWRQKHTNYPGPHRTDRTIVGGRLWPVYAMKSVSLFLIVFGILAGLGAFAQINPVWLYGPFFPAAVSDGVQPDWYFGWLEGALRIFPGWDMTPFGFLVPQPFFPGVLLPLVSFGFLLLWPFAAGQFTYDCRFRHVLDWPRDHPYRAALFAALVAFYFNLTLSGADDILSVIFHTRVSMMRDIFRGLVFGLPLIAAGATYLLMRRRTPASPPLASGD